MRNRVNGVFVLLTLMLSALIWSGCSKQPQPSGKDAAKAQPQPFGKYTGKAQSQPAGKDQPPPSDEVIVKAIDDSGVMKRADGSFEVIPPVKVVEKGKRNNNGTWPVKVQFTIKYKMKGGKVSPPTETTSLFSIFEEKDNTGKSVWKARLGS